MIISDLFTFLYDFAARYMPVFRVVWTITVLVGLFMLASAFIVKRNPNRKKAPWIVGGAGTLMVISSGTQLLFSVL